MLSLSISYNKNARRLRNNLIALQRFFCGPRLGRSLSVHRDIRAAARVANGFPIVCRRERDMLLCLKRTAKVIGKDGGTCCIGNGQQAGETHSIELVSPVFFCENFKSKRIF